MFYFVFFVNNDTHTHSNTSITLVSIPDLTQLDNVLGCMCKCVGFIVHVR